MAKHIHVHLNRPKFQDGKVLWKSAPTKNGYYATLTEIDSKSMRLTIYNKDGRDVYKIGIANHFVDLEKEQAMKTLRKFERNG